MTIGGRALGYRLGRQVAELRNRLSRARYFRGHGVHSPFVYDIVREVFMRHDLLPGDHTLFQTLLAAGISQRRAMQLQNLAIHCSYATFGLNRADVDLGIVLRQIPSDEITSLMRAAAENGTTLAIILPHDGRERQALCRRIIARHDSTSVDNRAYLLVFNNHLPKQHFRI